MLNKSGATQWTIGKLMTMVLLLVVLALVAYGVSTKGLNPLIERAGGMFDSVQILFGFRDDKSVDGDCGNSYLVEIERVGNGMITRCKGSCAVELEEGLDIGKIFNWTQGSLFVRKGSNWEMIFDFIDNLPLAIKEREVNKILKEDYKAYFGSSEGSSFMGSGIVPINILVKGNILGRKYFKWAEGVWFEEKENKWEERGWDDLEGLKKIYSKSGTVSYRVGTSSAKVRYNYNVKSKDFVLFEDIRADEDSYELFDIFWGKNPGKISDDYDFEIFQNWFFFEKKKVIENQKVLDDELRNFEELLPSESLGDFEGKPYYLFLDRDSDGDGVFYLETFVEKYGLKGEDLILVKGDGRDGWEFAESLSTLVGTEEEFEERIKIHQIRKFLEGLRC